MICMLLVLCGQMSLVSTSLYSRVISPVVLVSWHGICNSASSWELLWPAISKLIPNYFKGTTYSSSSSTRITLACWNGKTMWEELAQSKQICARILQCLGRPEQSYPPNNQNLGQQHYASNSHKKLDNKITILAATIEAPDVDMWQCPPSLKEWLKLGLGPWVAWNYPFIGHGHRKKWQSEFLRIILSKYASCWDLDGTQTENSFVSMNCKSSLTSWAKLGRAPHGFTSSCHIFTLP